VVLAEKVAKMFMDIWQTHHKQNCLAYLCNANY